MCAPTLPPSRCQVAEWNCSYAGLRAQTTWPRICCLSWARRHNHPAGPGDPCRTYLAPITPGSLNVWTKTWSRQYSMTILSMGWIIWTWTITPRTYPWPIDLVSIIHLQWDITLVTFHTCVTRTQTLYTEIIELISPRAQCLVISQKTCSILTAPLLPLTKAWVEQPRWVCCLLRGRCMLSRRWWRRGCCRGITTWRHGRYDIRSSYRVNKWTCHRYVGKGQLNGLVQGCGNSSALPMDLLQFRAFP